MDFVHLYDGGRFVPTKFKGIAMGPGGKLGYQGADHTVIDLYSTSGLKSRSSASPAWGFHS